MTTLAINMDGYTRLGARREELHAWLDTEGLRDAEVIALSVEDDCTTNVVTITHLVHDANGALVADESGKIATVTLPVAVKSLPPLDLLQPVGG